MASDKEQEWLSIVLKGTDPASATSQVFDCTTTSSEQSKTSQLKRKYTDDIHKAVMDDIKYLVPSALQSIKDIASKSKNESVKLKACQDLLSRAGYDAIQKYEDVTPLTKEELQAQINSLIDSNPDMMQTLLSMIEDADCTDTVKH